KASATQNNNQKMTARSSGYCSIVARSAPSLHSAFGSEIMKIFKRNRQFLSLVFLCLTIILLSVPASAAVIGDDVPLNSGDVLIGPCGVPGAMGPSGVNDDFTNRSVNTGIASVHPGGGTTAAGTIIFRNTIQNTGAGDDVFMITAPTAPTGFTIEMSIDNGDNYV